jgi:hypothetical protein
MTRLYEPDDGSYAQVGHGENSGRVYKRIDLVAGRSEARWFRLEDDNPHGLPTEGVPVLTWAEVLALGPINYIGRVEAA